jgi:hypothetical protein
VKFGFGCTGPTEHGTWSKGTCSAANKLSSQHAGALRPRQMIKHVLLIATDATALAPPFHVDRALDVVGLLCLRTAKVGRAQLSSHIWV